MVTDYASARVLEIEKEELPRLRQMMEAEGGNQFLLLISRARMMAKELVIWDCDGVLVDSEALLKTAEVEALHAAGFTEVTVDDCNRMFSGFAPEASRSFRTTGRISPACKASSMQLWTARSRLYRRRFWQPNN